MRHIFFLLSLTGAFMALGAEEYISPVTGQPYKPNDRYTFKDFKARDEAVMKKTGGFVLKKAEGPLALTIDTRAKQTSSIEEFAHIYKMGTKLDMNTSHESRNDLSPIQFAKKQLVEKSPLLVLCIVENCEELPALSVFPEDRIGVVNADKLQAASDDPAAPEMRITKELWRALGFIGGIGYSSSDNDIMRPYFSLREIDANNKAFIQPMNMLKMKEFFDRFGVKAARRVPYINACEQGWAPPPTNEYQKAVWDKVHQLPSEPIKIKPETKKVAE